MSGIPLYAILIAIGTVPSLVWLGLYLRKDCHPEPKHLIVKTFCMGIIVAPLVLIFQLLFVELVAKLCACTFSTRETAFFLWGAFVEEFFKFYAVKRIVLRNPEFDEPVDAMIYMITAALGFAAMENIIYLARTVQQGFALDLAAPDQISALLAVWTLRFTGATLLHALASALLGYFLALSWFFHEHRSKLLVIGLVMATVFHFTFNIFIASPGDGRQLFALASSTALLIAMAFLISILFDKIKERHSKSSVSLA